MNSSQTTANIFNKSHNRPFSSEVCEYDAHFDKMTKARVVYDYDDMGDDYDVHFNKMTKARVVCDYEMDGVYLIHPTAAILKNFSDMVKKSPIADVSGVFNHNKINKPRDCRKLARISTRGISAEFIKRFIIPNYDGRPDSLLELLTNLSTCNSLIK
jgi:hypothetical protein